VRYGYLKITRCIEDNIRIGKQGSIWDNGNTWDNATWVSFKLKCKDNMRFPEKKSHNFLLTTPFCVNKSFLVAYDVRELYKN
jgi:hypothetical protein